MQLSREEMRWLFDTLRKIEYFSLCTVGQIEDFVSIAVKENFEKGKVIVKQGERGGFFFIINKGEVSIWSEKSGLEKQKIANLGPGEFFGETALIEGKPRNATVIAETHCELIIFDGNSFINLLDKNPSLKEHFHKVAIKRDTERRLILSKTKKGLFQKLFCTK
jgi:CRP-like cAMP-binding protein